MAKLKLNETGHFRHFFALAQWNYHNDRERKRKRKIKTEFNYCLSCSMRGLSFEALFVSFIIIFSDFFFFSHFPYELIFSCNWTLLFDCNATMCVCVCMSVLSHRWIRMTGRKWRIIYFRAKWRLFYASSIQTNESNGKFKWTNISEKLSVSFRLFSFFHSMWLNERTFMSTLLIVFMWCAVSIASGK